MHLPTYARQQEGIRFQEVNKEFVLGARFWDVGIAREGAGIFAWGGNDFLSAIYALDPCVLFIMYS